MWQGKYLIAKTSAKPCLPIVLWGPSCPWSPRPLCHFLDQDGILTSFYLSVSEPLLYAESLALFLDVGFLYIQIKIWLSPVTMPILVFNHVWLCNPVACGLPGPSVHGILQARILEWAAISLSRELSWPRIKPKFPSLQADSLSSEQKGDQVNMSNVI